MQNPFKIQKKQTKNKTIIFPIQLARRIQEVIKSENISFSSFVIQACEYALKHIDSN